MANFPESGFKEYKNVRAFPLRTDSLSRDELAALYADMRQNYKGLSISRSQLVRRRAEGKQKAAELKRSLNLMTSDLVALEAEREKLKQSLGRSVQTQGKIQQERDEMSVRVQSLRQKIDATNSLLSDFEEVYESVVSDERNLSGFWRLLQAAKRLLNTDLKSLMMKRAEPQPPDEIAKIDEFKRETQADINRRLLDD